MLLGIFFLALVGLSWSLVGIIMGQAPKHGIDTGVIQLFAALVPFLVSLALFVTGLAPTISGTLKTGLIAGGIYFCSGMLNFVLIQTMAKAMQRGPNGIVWAIMQSGLIFPFCMGILFFDVPLTLTRGIGMAAILVAIILFALGKKNSGSPSRKWLWLSLLIFFLCGLQQMCSNIPSYIPAIRDGVSYYFRTFSIACGGIFMFLTLNFVFHKPHGFAEKFWFTVRKKLFWKYVLIKQGFGLIASYFLLYRGMDAMSEAGIGAVSYPLLIGSCIVAFSLYSILILKESVRRTQYMGLVLCLGGIVAICVK